MADDPITIELLLSGAFVASVPYDVDCTVRDLKLSAEGSTGVPAHYQRLYLQQSDEESLQDEHTLQSIGLGSGATIYLAFVPANAAELNQTFDYFCTRGYQPPRPDMDLHGFHGPLYAPDYASKERLRHYVFANLSDPNATDDFGSSVLCRAVALGQSEICTAILSHPDAVVDYKAVHAALELDHNLLRLLMHSERPFVDVIAGSDPWLARACWYRTTPCLAHLDRCEGRWDANTSLKAAGIALHRAAQSRRPHLCSTILTFFKTSINVSDGRGYTGLHHAAHAPSLACVRVFLQNPETDVNATDNWGNTPLHAAFERGHIEVCRVLLQDPRTDINAINNRGETVLHCVARANPMRNSSMALYYRHTPPYASRDSATRELSAELRQLIFSDSRFTGAHVLNIGGQTANMVVKERVQLRRERGQIREAALLRNVGRLPGRKKNRRHYHDDHDDICWYDSDDDEAVSLAPFMPILPISADYSTVGLISHLGSGCRSGRLSYTKRHLSRKSQGSDRRPLSAKAIQHVQVRKQRHADRVRAIASRRKAQASDLRRLCMYSDAFVDLC